MSITQIDISAVVDAGLSLFADLFELRDKLLLADGNLSLGTLDNDRITGSDDSDLLIGLSGDELLSGGDGDDFLLGGTGSDRLSGDAGDDFLAGNLGEDIVLYNQPQSDFIFKGNPDEFQVIGTEGRDTLTGIETLQFEDGTVDTDSLNFLPAPLYDDIEVIETTIPDTGDAIDIYLPAEPDGKVPVAILLQGANVDKSNYSTFANIVASYGFGVVVPNNLRTFDLPEPTPDVTGYIAELSQINEVFDYIRTPESPIDGEIDPNTLVLLGHSLGGAAGLYALQGACDVPNCPFGEFATRSDAEGSRPEELAGGIFFGTDLKPSLGDEPSPPIPLIDNNDLPTGLILGSNDGISFPPETKQTYEQIEDPPKALISVEGTNHFGITNENDPLNPPSTPAEVPPITPEPNPQEIPQEIAIDTIATWSSLFLRATVLEDPAAYDFVFGTGDELDGNASVSRELSSDL